MKKTILIGLVSLLLISLATAVIFTTKEEMLSYFNTYKQTRESNIESMVSTITYISDKICEIEYYSGEITCVVEFNYTITIDGKQKVRHDKIMLKEDSTVKEDDETVKEFVLRRIEDIIPIEEMGYKERDMKGREIQIEK